LTRTKLLTIIFVCLFAGSALGFAGGFFAYRIYPRAQAEAAAKKQQDALSQLVRSGSIVSVGAEAVALKVEDGPADVGQIITARVTPDTTVQVGGAVLNRPGARADITEWFTAGDTVDVMVEDGSLTAIFRPLKPGEEAVETLQTVQSSGGEIPSGDTASPPAVNGPSDLDNKG
jgi:hypothetical protein